MIRWISPLAMRWVESVKQMCRFRGPFRKSVWTYQSYQRRIAASFFQVYEGADQQQDGQVWCGLIEEAELCHKCILPRYCV